MLRAAAVAVARRPARRKRCGTVGEAWATRVVEGGETVRPPPRFFWSFEFMCELGTLLHLLAYVSHKHIYRRSHVRTIFETNVISGLAGLISC